MERRQLGEACQCRLNGEERPMSTVESKHGAEQSSTAISRRNYLKGAAGTLSGAALASAIGLTPPRAKAATELTYAFWPWGSEIVTDNARIFKEQYGENINLQPIPGEYAAVL